jgi:hypothetical protein
MTKSEGVSRPDLLTTILVELPAIGKAPFIQRPQPETSAFKRDSGQDKTAAVCQFLSSVRKKKRTPAASIQHSLFTADARENC